MPGSQKVKKGRLGYLDLHIRTLMYPSYNVINDPLKPSVLLVSYTQQQDAERIGALISPTSPASEDELKALLLRELARLHTMTPDDKAKLFNTISASYLNYYSYNWSHDAMTAGAFAFFRAQQFSTLQPKVMQLARDLVLISEALSLHHAWVVSAIKSAVTGLYAQLYSRLDIPGAREAVLLINGTTPYLSNTKHKHTKYKYLPFLGLLSYLPKQHARQIEQILAFRAKKAAQRE